MDIRKLKSLFVTTGLVCAGSLAYAQTGTQPGSQQPATRPSGQQAMEGQQARSLAVGDLAKNSAQYYGQRVSIAAEVEDVLSPYGFTLDEDSTFAGPDVLVLIPHPDTSQQIGKDDKVTVTGKVRRFVRAELDREFDWFGEVGQKWEVEYSQRPVLVAESVRTAAGKELVRKDPTAGSASSTTSVTPPTSARTDEGALPASDADPDTTEPAEGRGDPTISATRQPPGTPGTTGTAGTSSMPRTGTTAGATGSSGSAMSTTAGEMAKNPHAYYGKRVTVTAEVEDTFGSNAFTLDEDAMFAGPDVLVVFPSATGAIPEDRKVTVTGNVLRYSAAEFDRDYDWFEPRAEWEVQFRERPVIVADSVKTEDGRELLSGAPQSGQR